MGIVFVCWFSLNDLGVSSRLVRRLGVIGLVLLRDPINKTKWPACVTRCQLYRLLIVFVCKC